MISFSGACLQIPLGVINKNENKGDEMVEIVSTLQKYIPVHQKCREQTLSNGEVATVIDTSLHRLLFGGDQLTAARGRGAQSIRENGRDSVTRLEGFHMFSLDWHAKMKFLGVRQNIFI